MSDDDASGILAAVSSTGGSDSRDRTARQPSVAAAIDELERTVRVSMMEGVVLQTSQILAVCGGEIQALQAHVSVIESDAGLGRKAVMELNQAVGQQFHKLNKAVVEHSQVIAGQAAKHEKDLRMGLASIVKVKRQLKKRLKKIQARFPGSSPDVSHRATVPSRVRRPAFSRMQCFSEHAVLKSQYGKLKDDVEKRLRQVIDYDFAQYPSIAKERMAALETGIGELRVEAEQYREKPHADIAALRDEFKQYRISAEAENERLRMKIANFVCIGDIRQELRQYPRWAEAQIEALRMEMLAREEVSEKRAGLRAAEEQRMWADAHELTSAVVAGIQAQSESHEEVIRSGMHQYIIGADDAEGLRLEIRAGLKLLRHQVGQRFDGVPEQIAAVGIVATGIAEKMATMKASVEDLVERVCGLEGAQTTDYD
jgi:hypothetical protein